MPTATAASSSTGAAHDATEDDNKCHLDCSGRGVCDFTTGACRCFKGYASSNCGAYEDDGYSLTAQKRRSK
ncbi:hypothetical protein JKP88DRAFT_274931 [Tribonema minus]|uniref:EGF-like domain-containing protein n=1 Tax=Tribonema minus TaxID=303371 RepID=A0A835ZCP0_9STRA|nr:hypothetical protein JKP88DRAFT_274931 [Tribonema minus]